MRRMAKMFAEGIDVAERPDAIVDAGPRTKADMLTQAANNLVGKAREAPNPQRTKLFGDAISKYEAADRLLPNNYEILYFWAGAIAESSSATQQRHRSVEMMARSVSLEPRWSESRQALATVLEFVGREAEAVSQRNIGQTLSGAVAQAYRHAGQGNLADSVWSFGLGCPARICVQGIYPFSPRLAAFVERTAKSEGLASKSENGDEGEPVAVLYRNAVAPGPISPINSNIPSISFDFISV